MACLREHLAQQQLYDQEGQLDWNFFLESIEVGALKEEGTVLNMLVNQIISRLSSKDLVSFINQIESAMGP